MNLNNLSKESSEVVEEVIKVSRLPKDKAASLGLFIALAKEHGFKGWKE